MSLPGSALPPLLWRTAWRHAVQHRWQTCLNLLGITLGVMMLVAVDLASNSAQRAFDLSVDSVTGNITHQIVGGSAGVPDAIFTALRTELKLKRSAPTLMEVVGFRGEDLTLLGLDPFSEAELQRQQAGVKVFERDRVAVTFAAMARPDAMLMSAALAKRLGLAVGDSFLLDVPHRDTELTLAATEDTNRDDLLLFTDIAQAQRLLNKQGRLDSIDLILNNEEAEILRNWLPDSLALVEAGARTTALEQMTQAFRTNLLAMSLLALLVAALLIYNTVSLSVLERRSSFGVLRSLGITRGELRRLILLENAMLGIVASVLGVVAGLALGSVLVKLVTRTIDDLYFNLTVTSFMIDPLLLLKGFAWGLGMTLLAAALPAWQAGRTLPVTLQQKGMEGEAIQRRLPLLSIAGLVLLASGALLLQASNALLSGFIALNFLIFGFCLLIPQALQYLLQGLLALLAPVLDMQWRLALRSIQSGLDRTALAVAALTVAVSVTVGVGVMTTSLRDTVILWLDQSLVGDLQVTRLDGNNGIAPELQAAIAGAKGVARATRGYLFNAESSLGPVRVQAQSGNPDDWLFLKEGGLNLQANQVLVSEPLAWYYTLEIGDSFALHTPSGYQTLEVAGIFHDYTTGNPLLAISIEQAEAYWPAFSPRRMTLFLDVDIEPTALVPGIRELTRNQDGVYGVAPNGYIRNLTLEIFDRTFAITHVLRILAIVVAFVGVLSAMLALQLQRMRDYAILRASGMTIGQVARLIVQQTFVMGLLAGLLALPLGLLMSRVLIEVINQRSFGWSMLHSLPPGVLSEALVLATLAALLAGIYPAMRVARVQTAIAMRQE